MVKIISWNPNGIRALMKKINMNKFINDNKPDILCFNEIKASEPINTIYLHLHYKYQYWNISKRKGYAGTVTFSLIKPLSVDKSPFDDEGRLICLEFDKYYVINVYVPNSGAKLARLKYRTEVWDIKLREYISKLKKPVIIVGDLNVAHHEIDIARPKTNLRTAGYTIEERKSFQKLLDMGFIDTYRSKNPDEVKYSYWSYRTRGRERNVGWRIDYGLVSKDLEDKIEEVNILDKEMGSDHCPVSLIIGFEKDILK